MQPAFLALLGLVSVFISWIMVFILPGTRVFAWIIMGFGAALIGTAFVVDFRRVRKTLMSRRGKLGVGATVRLSLFLGIVVAANAISTANYQRFDLTGLEQFTLTSQTKDVLAHLDQPVEIVSFFTPDVSASVSTYATSLLNEYANYTDHLTLRLIDPDLNPDQARAYGVDQLGAVYGVVMFKGSQGRRMVYGPQITVEAEHEFTSAILEVTGRKQKKVYFLTGHGEGGISADFSAARDSLRDNLFQVMQLDLLAAQGIPDDAAVVIIAGPQRPLVESEYAILTDYLKKNGRMLVMLNPNPPEAYRRLLSGWSVTFRSGVLVDPTSHVVPNVDNILVPRTRNAFQLSETYFLGATAVIPADTRPAGVKLTPLVWTSPEAWLESAFVSGTQPVFDKATDVRGPFAIGVLVDGVSSGDAVSAPKGTRLAVFGDSDFATNANFSSGTNGDLFVSVVNWLAAGQEIISVNRRVLTTRRLLLSPEEARFMNLSSIGLLPLILLLVAGYLWWRRRR
jgi:ABC-type uncharacterized transport system involved in gliding motility auxiliary subunit